MTAKAKAELTDEAKVAVAVVIAAVAADGKVAIIVVAPRDKIIGAVAGTVVPKRRGRLRPKSPIPRLSAKSNFTATARATAFCK